MMARLIDADALKEHIKKWYWDENLQSAKDDPAVIDAMIDLTIRTVKEAPTIEAEPVRHGRWIDNTKLIYGFLDVQFNCSECDYVSWIQTEGLHYCPNCGAKMDGGKKNGCTD